MRTRQAIVVVASVLALALTASAVLATSARATFPGRNGLIAFSARVAGSSRIFVVNPDGSGLRQVTHEAAGCLRPSVSPDGRTIAFLSDHEIRAVATTGAKSWHLASGFCDWPAFSPNGRQVVFATYNPPVPQVWMMNTDGSRQRRLTALGRDVRDVWSPTYSPDGKTIVFVASLWVALNSPKNGCEILAMNADGSHLRRLAYTTEADYIGGTTWGVSFSPDGKTIVYSAHTSKDGFLLRVMNANGAHQRLLPRSYGFTWPSYSPDGRQILCVNGHRQICVVNVNGTHWRRLTSVSGGVDWSCNWGPHVR